ncbi:unnamed protein product [Taenia asiatica]|uniref:Alpha-helical coiled-coil rod protein n=1 Tax=Taenia asiatica TaxID=60517 RepID=A0A0R3W3Y3_TAEAS|nr:unnamed protein product [Taenia asiatica]
MPYQELSGSNPIPKAPEGTILLPSSANPQPTGNRKTVPSNERRPKHKKPSSPPHGPKKLTCSSSFEDSLLSSEHLRRFLAAGSESDSNPANNFNTVNCSKNCPHLEWCLILEKELTKVKQELTEAKMINASVNSELTTLRTLVSGARTAKGGSHNASSRGNCSHDQLSTELEQTMAENEVLKDEIHLLRVQLESLESILQVQEKAAASTHNASAHQAGDTTESISTYDRLLRAWRHQVMRLLIERVVQEEICTTTYKATQDQLSSQGEQLKNLQAQNRTLSRKLVAKSAALKANFKKSEDYSREVQHLNHCLQISNNSNTCLNECTKSALTRLHADLIAMNEQWNRVFTDDGDTDSSPLMRRLRRLERRIQCVSGRLPMVRVLLSRNRTPKQRVERVSCGVQVYSTLRLPPINAVLPNNVEDLKEMVLAAQSELALALADRDLISRRLIMDAQDSDERMNDLRRKHAHEMALLKHRLEEVEKSLGEKTLVDEWNHHLSSGLERAEERVATLEAEHKRIVCETTEEKVKLETELTDAKSDLAKALISARRAERMAMQANNEKEAQVQLIISALESEYEEKIAQLQKTQRETIRESLFRPILPPLNRPAYLRPGEAFIHQDLPVQFASKAGEKSATNGHKEVKPTRSEGSVLESLPSDQLESVRETLNKLAVLAKQLEQ